MLRRRALIGVAGAIIGIAAIPAMSYSAAGAPHARCAAKSCKSRPNTRCKTGHIRRNGRCVKKKPRSSRTNTGPATTTPTSAPGAAQPGAERPKLPLDASFLSPWYVGGKPAIEQFSLETGAPLRTLLLGKAGSFASGPEGMLWLTVTSGPKAQCERCKESASVPDSCTNEVLRFDPLTGDLATERTFPSSMLIAGAQPSPNGQWLLMEVGGCTGSYMSMHLLAINLKTGAEWTVGSEATACHDLRTPAWSANSSELIVPYGPSNLPAGITQAPDRGAKGESCLEPQPAGLAVVKAGSSSEFSPSTLIEPAPGCSYESAVFDSEGILAVEGCSEGSPPFPVIPSPVNGQAYLVQLTATGEVLRRLPLAIGSNPGIVASDPETGTILVTDDQAGGPQDKNENEGDWVWEYHNGSLRLIKRYSIEPGVYAKPW